MLNVQFIDFVINLQLYVQVRNDLSSNGLYSLKWR